MLPETAWALVAEGLGGPSQSHSAPLSPEFLIPLLTLVRGFPCAYSRFQDAGSEGPVT